MRVLALDGHDGAGKTTLARNLAERVGARYARPFAGARGAELMRAYACADARQVLEVGARAIAETLAETGRGALVLDRGWLTVSTLVPEALFTARWCLWVPTVLLWCDLATTLQRLESRADEASESVQWHETFLATYQARRLLRAGPVVRTDLQRPEASLDELVRIYTALPEFGPEETPSVEALR